MRVPQSQHGLLDRHLLEEAVDLHAPDGRVLRGALVRKSFVAVDLDVVEGAAQRQRREALSRRVRGFQTFQSLA